MNYLIDSNLFIYAALPEKNEAYRFLLSQEYYWYASITLIEVLGYPRLTSPDEARLKIIFARGRLLRLSSPIIKKAISLRQERKMSLGDAIIGATAWQHQLALATRNLDDFKHIHPLVLHNSFEAAS